MKHLLGLVTKNPSSWRFLSRLFLSPSISIIITMNFKWSDFRAESQGRDEGEMKGRGIKTVGENNERGNKVAVQRRSARVSASLSCVAVTNRAFSPLPFPVLHSSLLLSSGCVYPVLNHKLTCTCDVTRSHACLIVFALHNPDLRHRLAGSTNLWCTVYTV